MTICSLPNCNNPLPMGRTKYCSHACLLVAKKIRQQEEVKDLDWKKKLNPIVKRVCLKCDRTFGSRGNRICPRCTRNNRENMGEYTAEAAIFWGGV